MKLYKISQTANMNYDTYDSAVVAAPDEATAQRMSPCEESWLGEFNVKFIWVEDPSLVTVEYLGETHLPQGVICSSFNAG